MKIMTEKLIRFLCIALAGMLAVAALILTEWAAAHPDNEENTHSEVMAHHLGECKQEAVTALVSCSGKTAYAFAAALKDQGSPVPGTTAFKPIDAMRHARFQKCLLNFHFFLNECEEAKQ